MLPGTTPHLPERLGEAAFLVSGGALACSTLLKGIEWFTAVSPPTILVVLFAALGMAGLLAGLAALYPPVVERTPRLARLAGAVVAVTGLGVALVFGWGILGIVTSVASPPAVVFVSVVVLLWAGSALFAIAWLRAALAPRRVGVALLGFAGTWGALAGSGLVLGAAVPSWLLFAIYGAQPLLLALTARALGSSRTAPAIGGPADDVTAH